MKQERNKLYVISICAVLVIATAIAYEQVRYNDFVGYDDYRYVTENPNVNEGITRESILWAFTTPYKANWHPLTWLSHMLDCQLFGLNPAWHHIINLLFHTANTLLLFWIFKRMTGTLWQSAFVAAVFALHPLHVESVAWVAERKDVLSGFFWMLTMIAYVRYAEQPRIRRYLPVILAFCLGLLSKPMLVSLPFVLLLLDYWPLDRLQWGNRSTWRLIVEKIPLFVLAAASSLVTYIIQQQAGAMAEADKLPLSFRTTNALVSYISYIGKMVYSSRLAVFYPHPLNKLPIWQPTVSAVMLAVISTIVIYMGRRRRYLVVGWLWYLGTLVPVIGLVQVGGQAMADRYTYLPLIGVFIMVSWGAADLTAKLRYRNTGLGITASIILVVLLICTRMQLNYWQNTFTLSSHALKVTTGNYKAHGLLGWALYKQGHFEDAIHHYKESLKLRPNDANTEGNMGAALLELGRLDEAAVQFRKALMLKGDMQKWHSGLAITLDKLGQLDEAIEHYRQALKLKSDDPPMHEGLATALCRKGNFEEAVKDYEDWFRLNPNNAEIAKNMGNIYQMAGKTKQAIDCWVKALELKPDSSEVLNNLAWTLSTTKDNDIKNLSDAVKYAQRACKLTDHKQAELLDTLAAAYAAAGKFNEAIETAERAIKSAEAAGKKELAAKILKRLELYKAGQPYHEK